MEEKKKESKTTSKKRSKKLDEKKAETKKAVHNRKRNAKKEKKKFFNADNILKLVFTILLILVIVLAIMVVKKDNEAKSKVTANISIPVYDTDNQSSVTINADELSSEYIVKVTNYKSDTPNTEKLTYSVEIVNDTSSTVKVTKNNDKKNLMVDKSDTIIEGETLKKNVKQNVYYHISIDDLSKVKDKETIVIKVIS